MALTKNTTTVTNIADLSSTPNATEGLTAAQLQAKFDKTGADLKTYINDTLTAELDTEVTNLQSGWICATETWTFVSVDDPTGVIKVQADVTTKYSLGMRIKFTNGGNVIYGILTKIGTFGGDAAGYTYLTFLHEIDPTDNLALYLMANSAITLNCYSSEKVPFGFPTQKEKWTILNILNETSQATPTNGTWYNIGTTKITVPIGNWNVSYITACAAYVGATADIQLYVALSSTNNSASYEDLSSFVRGNALQYFGAIYSGNKDLSFTTKTDLYLNEKVTTNSISAIEVAKNSKIIIKAISTYV